MISLVIPTYNEKANMAPLVSRIAGALAATGEPFEAIVVDDNSPDGTADEVRHLQAERPWLRLVERKNDRDLSRAVVEGWRQARGDVLGCMDADLQHPPEVLTELTGKLREGTTDLVVASRYTAGGGVGKWNLLRRLVSRGATLLASLILPGKVGRVTDPMSGFFLVRRRAANIGELRPSGYKILVELLVRGNCRQVAEVPFVFANRERGESKARLKTSWEFAIQIGRLSIATGEAARMVKFGLVGLTGVPVNFVAFYLLRLLNCSVPLAAASASAMAILNNFTWNEIYTFREVHQADGGLQRMAHRLVLFSGICLFGLGINTVTTTALTMLMPWFLALSIAIALASGWNYFANARMTWREWTVAERIPSVAHAKAAATTKGREAA